MHCRHLTLLPSPEESVPTDVTSTAAYVSSGSSFSTLHTLIPNYNIREKMTTATDIVTILSTSEGLKFIITIGKIRHAPPLMTIMNLASVSTNLDVYLGVSLCLYFFRILSWS